MTFLTLSDFEPHIKADNLQAVIDADATILDRCEVQAISMVEQYLYALYDTEDAFGKSGTERYNLLIWWLVVISLYNLYKRLPKRQIPDHRVDDYKEAITNLERIADQKQGLPIKRRLDTDGNDELQFRWGSNPTRGH